MVDSREAHEGLAIRRRRQCGGCERRFTTYEAIEDVQVTVVKKDDTRETFDRNKLIAGLERACQRRPVSRRAINGFVDHLEADLAASGRLEVPSR